jgi:predicted dehydrogenase
MKQSRRNFITKATASGVGITLGLNSISTISGMNPVFKASDKIRMGFIGVGNRGSQLMNLFMQNPDCEVAALCDVYEPYVLRDFSKIHPRYVEMGKIPKMGETFSKPPKVYKDYRKLLDDKDIDAVCIATPDHWHALQTIHAIQAGKDVFVEKPLTATILEGRKMVMAEAASKQVVAVGLNRRGSATYQKLAKEIPNGKIGKVTVASAFRINNMFPDGIGKLSPEQPPSDFNWDMWLGPRAARPYQYNIAPYMFRWWSDYSSQMGNWGVHFMDVIRWMMGETAPTAISAHGGKYVLDHDGDIPDTMQVTFEFASGAVVSFCIYEASSGGLFPWGEVELRGTKGTLHASENGYRVTPTRSGQFQNWDKLMDAEEFDAKNEMLSDGSSGNSTATLVRNFLDCAKTREKPLCTLEDGHRSTSFAHLANIALATKERLQWDPANERFLNSEKANQLLHYEYRKPWEL